MKFNIEIDIKDIKELSDAIFITEDVAQHIRLVFDARFKRKYKLKIDGKEHTFEIQENIKKKPKKIYGKSPLTKIIRDLAKKYKPTLVCRFCGTDLSCRAGVLWFGDPSICSKCKGGGIKWVKE